MNDEMKDPVEINKEFEHPVVVYNYQALLDRLDTMNIQLRDIMNILGCGGVVIALALILIALAINIP